MLTIAGKLVTPTNVGIAGATIRFIATDNTEYGAVRGTMSTFNTDTSGDYSQSILPGKYKIEFKNSGKDKYISIGNATLPTYGTDLPNGAVVTDTFKVKAVTTTNAVAGAAAYCIDANGAVVSGVTRSACLGVASRQWIPQEADTPAYTTDEEIEVVVTITGTTDPTTYTLSGNTGTVTATASGDSVAYSVPESDGTYGSLSVNSSTGAYTYTAFTHATSESLENLGIW